MSDEESPTIKTIAGWRKKVGRRYVGGIHSVDDMELHLVFMEKLQEAWEQDRYSGKDELPLKVKNAAANAFMRFLNFNEYRAGVQRQIKKKRREATKSDIPTYRVKEASA